MSDHELLESEVALVRRILQGETEAYYQLVRPYQRMIYASAFSILRSEVDAEDVVQQTFLNGLAALRSFRAQSRILTWLIQIAINEARMRLRRDRLRRSVSIEEVSMNFEQETVVRDLIEWKRIPSSVLERKETREILLRAFESLPRIYREVFVLRDVEELSISETAKVLGIQEVNVKTRLSRARMKMRDLIAGTLGSRLACAPAGNRETLGCPMTWKEASNFIDGDLVPVLRTKITAHLRICRRCSSVVAGIKNVVRLMSDPRALPLPAGFSRRLRKLLTSYLLLPKAKRVPGGQAGRHR